MLITFYLQIHHHHHVDMLCYYKTLMDKPCLLISSIVAHTEIAYSMSRYLISISTYLSSAKRVRTLQPNLVKYECDPDFIRHVDVII